MKENTFQLNVGCNAGHHRVQFYEMSEILDLDLALTTPAQ